LAAAVFDPANPITTGMSLKEADASPLRSPNDTDSRVVTLHLHTLNQARTIGEFFREGTPLVLDLTEMTDDVADRIIHFSAGLIFGLRGSLERVMSKVFVLYPANVDIEVRNQAIADAHRLQARLTEAPKRQQQPSKAQIPQDLLPVIKVVGIGGGGVNAVSRMVEEERIGVQVIAVDTDALALRFSDADAKLEVGRELTRGHGGSANPEVGAQATEDHREEIEEALRGADMVFITAGEGGGTGTGGAPVVASVARTLGALTIGIVTRPFGFEGKHRSAQAEQGIERLRNEVDTLIVIPNDRLLTISHRQISVLDAFKAADQVLLSGIACVTDLITRPGLINLGFSAVKSVLSGGGLALMGTGSSRGDDRVVAAAEFASCSPLLEAGIDGARKVVLSVQGGSDPMPWALGIWVVWAGGSGLLVLVTLGSSWSGACQWPACRAGGRPAPRADGRCSRGRCGISAGQAAGLLARVMTASAIRVPVSARVACSK